MEKTIYVCVKYNKLGLIMTRINITYLYINTTYLPFYVILNFLILYLFIINLTKCLFLTMISMQRQITVV